MLQEKWTTLDLNLCHALLYKSNVLYTFTTYLDQYFGRRSHCFCFCSDTQPPTAFDVALVFLGLILSLERLSKTINQQSKCDIENPA